MPRGVPKFTLDQQIEKLTKEIEKTKSTLSDQKKQLSELIEKKKNKELKELQALIDEKKLSVGEIKNLVEKNHSEKKQ